MAKEFIPFGKEWEEAINKLPKKDLIGLLRKACIINVETEDSIPKNPIINSDCFNCELYKWYIKTKNLPF
jgi:hypothetical protein